MHRPLQQTAPWVNEKPQNGIAGLKHWQYDLRSGFMVAMISLPFSMGIAITSGAPPVCGIVSAIIAGFLLPFLGGSYVTISGPAAGLAPAIYAGIAWMGGVYLGEGASSEQVMAAGYPLVLVAIAIAGALQVVLAKLKVARLSAIFPAAAIEGMLVAIGLMIIVKQIPLLLGQKFEGHEFWEILAETPSKLRTMNVQVFGLGMACVALLFILSAVPGRLLKMLPPPVWVFFLGAIGSRMFLSLGPENLINVPSAPLANGIVLPKFATVFGDPELWLPLAYMMFTLMLIDGTESLATINAVDKLDPFRRRSDPDRTLQAMGVSNVASSMLGGLTIIPGIVKSTANIIGGGRTQWANFYNACFLLIFLIFAREWINMVPTAVLAAILVFVGFKLCRPKVWRQIAHVGAEQFVICAVTVLVTVTTDLLIGVFTGMGLKLVLNVWYSGLAEVLFAPAEDQRAGFITRFANLFRNPVSGRAYCEGVYDLFFDRPLVCFNLLHVIRELERIPADAQMACLHISPRVTLVDHTTSETLLHYVEEHNSQPGSSRRLQVNGLDSMRRLSKHYSGMRLNVLQPDDNRGPIATLAEEGRSPSATGNQASGSPLEAPPSSSPTRRSPAAGNGQADVAPKNAAADDSAALPGEATGAQSALASKTHERCAAAAAGAEFAAFSGQATACCCGDSAEARGDREDLAWLGLVESDESRAAGGDPCRQDLVSQHDPKLESPDPFLSNEEWRRIVAKHPR